MKTNQNRWFGQTTLSACPALLGLLAAAVGCAPAAGGEGATTPGQEGVVIVGADSGDSTKVDPPPPPPNVRVNQVGYLPQFAKFATAVTDAASALKWELVDGSGKVLASGQTKPFGHDAEAGEKVHIIDFSSHQQPGKDLKLRVGKDESYPFDIGADIYHQMKYDAIWYFYHNRSGIELKMPYAGNEEWTRPAGHLSDKDTPCAKDAGCSYSLDVTGGWYDAGDHGKYVVNGGISLWTLQALYERMKHLAPDSLEAFADGKLRIPENKNGRPDILDEARWEMEWLLKMQMPEDKDADKAGMAHHKMHDEKWTGLGYNPPTQTQIKRYLRPVSTAATLNLAATAAQAARIWKKLDPDFSKKCLTAAERAWQAANKHPKLFALESDKTGGGPYDDDIVADEFYWAAAELFITTKKAEYKQYIAKSPHYLKLPQGADKDGQSGPPSAMTWQLVAALGTISLAVVPNDLGKAEVKKAQQAIVATADSYLKLIDSQGHRLPMKAGKDGKYPWGSNSFVVNNGIITALAHDFSKEQKYVDGVIAGMNYILGQNAMGQSYVSGYGERPLQNPHHRFWSHQKVEVMPSPPPGCISGGPNSSIQDPYAQTNLKGCKPQKCFMDHIESWSTNEITINWNAPFTWVTTFLDEQSKAK